MTGSGGVGEELPDVAGEVVFEAEHGVLGALAFCVLAGELGAGDSRRGGS